MRRGVERAERQRQPGVALRLDRVVAAEASGIERKITNILRFVCTQCDFHTCFLHDARILIRLIIFVRIARWHTQHGSGYNRYTCKRY